MTKPVKDSVLQGIWDALRLFPFSLAAGVCSGFGLSGGFVAAVVCGIAGVLFGASFCPSWLTLLAVYMLAFRFGAGCAGAAIVLGGVFTYLWTLLPAGARKRLTDPSALSGFIPAAAFVTTALQTTNYFGIGAVGGTAREIIADYISLGFHPNWRGILYGTIALVLLITYPRKFKQLHKKISPAFAVLLVVLPLQLLLVPDAVHSPINEIGAADTHAFFENAFLRGAWTPAAVPAVLCTALTLMLLTVQNLPAASGRKLAAVQLLSGFLGGVPAAADDKPRSRIGALVCALLSAALYFVPGLSRFPVHALAVILIVTAWQNVPWGNLRTAFSGTRNRILFFGGVLLPVLLGVHYAVPLLFAAAALTKSKTPSMQS